MLVTNTILDDATTAESESGRRHPASQEERFHPLVNPVLPAPLRGRGSNKVGRQACFLSGNFFLSVRHNGFQWALEAN